MAETLGPGAAARLLGVAPATLRSWDRRYGIGPRERSSGGHRRYTEADVERLRELCRLVGEGVPVAEAADRVRGGVPAPRGEHPPTGAAEPPAVSLPGLTSAAMRMDSDLVEALLEGEARDRGAVRFWEELAMPLLYGMGRKWEVTRRHVEVEHLLSWCVSSVLRRVPAAEPGPERPVALVCVPHESHSLPVEALAAALRERGKRHRMLGACTPVEAAVRTLERTGPRALVLWCHASGGSETTALSAVARAARSAPQTVSVYTAGPGWRSAGALLRVADGHFGSLTGAVGTLAR